VNYLTTEWDVAIPVISGYLRIAEQLPTYCRHIVDSCVNVLFQTIDIHTTYKRAEAV